ncbi:MAG: hypothetical protein FWE14_13095 [Lachnospiraceae bacterium]|nr:hypothetical protein [Lachnospiraceae bacterium]
MIGGSGKVSLIGREMQKGYIDLDNVAFKLMVEEKFTVKGRGLAIAGSIISGKITSGDEVFITDKAEKIKAKTEVIVDIFCTSKMSMKDTAIAPMTIALWLKDVSIDEVETGDYVVMC